jgi:histone H3/H4
MEAIPGKKDYRIQHSALLAIQEAAESYLVRFVSAANIQLFALTE